MIMKKIKLLILGLLFANISFGQIIEKIKTPPHLDNIYKNGTFVELLDTIRYVYASDTNEIMILNLINDSLVPVDSLTLEQNLWISQIGTIIPSVISYQNELIITDGYGIFRWQNTWSQDAIDSLPENALFTSLGVTHFGPTVIHSNLTETKIGVYQNHWETLETANPLSGRGYAYPTSIDSTLYLASRGSITRRLSNGEFEYVDDLYSQGLKSTSYMTKIDSSLFYHANNGHAKSITGQKIVTYDNNPRTKFYFFTSIVKFRNRLWATDYNYLYRYGVNGWIRADTAFISKSYVVKNKLLVTGPNVIGQIRSDVTEINGNYYYDLNNDCTMDSTDIPISEILFVNNGDIKINSIHGQYDFLGFLDSTYTIKPRKPYTAKGFSCVEDSVVIHVGGSVDTFYTQDFPLQIDSSVTDLGVSIGHGRAIKGDTMNGFITLNNETIQGHDFLQVTMEYDKRLSHFKSDGFQYIRADNSVTFTIPHIKSFESIHIPYELFCDPISLNLGDTICISAKVETRDFNTNNDADTIYRIIRTAYDPNEKISFPTGAIKESVEKIDYTIHFQNLGNYHARNVRVVDSLHTNLPIEFIRIKATSHPETYSLEVRNNVLIWTFNGINLPDSSSDPEGSKGYICYEAKVKSTFIKQGDQIDNKAEIYFDYERPVVTNFASVYLRDETSSIFERHSPITKHLTAFPNPFASTITIKNNGTTPENLKFYNFNGKLIKQGELKAKGEFIFDTSDLVSGLYFIRSSNGETIKVVKN
ncbi:MAG: hypothetical protein COA58_10000 [Bacteroidetes bacterium]|nr:MAG: hypothetical protein COA58_10000 [Bacteroidota bacterium]